MSEFNITGFSQERDIKAMLEKEKTGKNDTAHVNLLLSICDSLILYKPDEIIQYGIKAAEIAGKLKFLKGEAYSFKYIGLVYLIKGDYVKAMDYFQQSLEIFESIDYKNGIANMLNNIGVIYNNQGDDAKALEVYLQSLKIAEEINDSLRIESALCNIAVVYEKRESTVDKAKEYYLKALEISEKIGYRTGSRINYANLGSICFNKGNYSEALSYLKKSLVSFQDTNSFYGVSALIQIGETYTRQNDYENAVKNLETAFEIAGQNNYKLEMGKAALAFGKTYLQKGETQKALDYLKLSEKIIREVGASHELKEVYEGISRTYAKRADFINAYNYLLMENNLKDTLFTEMNQLQLSQLQVQYEIKLMLRENENLKSEAILKDAKSKLQVTLIAILILGFALISVFLVLISRANNSKKKVNRKLNITLDIVNSQKKQIETAHEEITASINYARSIQSSVLPKADYIESLLPEYFILYKPAEIVSGDFYWVTEIDDKTIIAVADCTGHGVPGAFMSMLGITLLDEIVNKERSTSPDIILNRLRKEVISALKQKGELKDQKDGIDIAICTIDRINMKLQFAGAINPLYLIRDSKTNNSGQVSGETPPASVITEFKGDPMSAGISDNMDDFKVHEIDIRTNDRYYLFTDGYADQFGGTDHKRFSFKRFREQLIKTRNLSLPDQKIVLERVLLEWMNNNIQTDDILVLGFRIG